MRLDFVFGLPADDKGNTGILVFVCRLSKMDHLDPVCDKVPGKQVAQLFLGSVFRYHGLPETIVSDREPRITGSFWDTLFQLLGTELTMATADHPQTERVNRVLEDTLRSICAEASRSWSDQLSMVEFALNNAVHASKSLHRRWGKGPENLQSQVSDIEPESLKRQLPSFLDDRLTLVSRVRDTMIHVRDKQNEYFDREGRGNLISTKNLPLKVVSSVESNKLKHRFIGPFAVLARHGMAYTIDLPKAMATHPTFYVGHLKRYHDPQGLFLEEE
ncbi:LOW QUALITY PROTEIN: Pol protein [Phytophthora palmivora]|uniref:Pol protein n=1 Tax=Phytophthora palmivora TaxID=4796 RepID=A0A2P4YG20_9STRA|nr:LOW QUALITY PROTEIN: Pol protein [Phytophthora palmivora]